MNKKTLIIIGTIGFICLSIWGLYLIVKHDNYDENLFTEISYNVPSEFKADGDYIYSRHYGYDMNSVYCNFNVYASQKDYYDGLKDWFSERISFNLNDKVSDLTEVTINGNKMLYIDKKSKNDIDYYYGVEASNYYYLLTYTIYDSSNGDRSDYGSNLCDTAKDKILETVNVK